LPDPNAQVWFEGTATSQRGSMRQFESPQLTPGRDYIYGIRAEWNQNGKTVSQTREVRLQAGDQLTVDFGRQAPPRQAPPRSSTPPPPPRPRPGG
jgi:uncharacterized protein (TIGR03000 family)